MVVVAVLGFIVLQAPGVQSTGLTALHRHSVIHIIKLFAGSVVERDCSRREVGWGYKCMEDYLESDEEQFTAPNQPTVIHPPPFQSSKGMQKSPLKSSVYIPSIGEDGLAPWTPPKPTPSDRPPARLSSSDFSSLDRFPKSSVTFQPGSHDQS